MRALVLVLITISALASAPARAGDPSGEAPSGRYSQEAGIQLAWYSDSAVESNRLLVGYRYYFDDIVDDDKPYRLQPFLQKATYLEGTVASGPLDAGSLAVGGRYMFPDSPFGALLAAGRGKTITDDDAWFVNLGFDFYIVDEFAVEARVGFGHYGTDYNQLQGGVRFLAEVIKTGDTIEFYAGFRSLSNDEEVAGLVAEARYFFDKHLFAGVGVSGDTGLVGLSAGYTAEMGFLAEIELGIELDDEKEGLEDWGEFFSIMVGLQF